MSLIAKVNEENVDMNHPVADSSLFCVFFFSQIKEKFYFRLKSDKYDGTNMPLGILDFILSDTCEIPTNVWYVFSHKNSTNNHYLIRIYSNPYEFLLKLISNQLSFLPFLTVY